MKPSRQRNLQLASDDVAVIAETVETLAKLLDLFQATYDEDLWSQFERAFPAHVELDKGAATKLYEFARRLEPDA